MKRYYLVYKTISSYDGLIKDFKPTEFYMDENSASKYSAFVSNQLAPDIKKNVRFNYIRSIEA